MSQIAETNDIRIRCPRCHGSSFICKVTKIGGFDLKLNTRVETAYSGERIECNICGKKLPIELEKVVRGMKVFTETISKLKS